MMLTQTMKFYRRIIMPNVKIIQINGYYCYECGHIEEALVGSDWTEVSDEEVDLLQRHLPKNKNIYVVVQKEPEQIQNYISDIREYIKKEAEKAEKKSAVRKKKLAETRNNRKKKKMEEFMKLKKELNM